MRKRPKVTTTIPSALTENRAKNAKDIKSLLNDMMMAIYRRLFSFGITFFLRSPRGRGRGRHAGHEVFSAHGRPLSCWLSSTSLE